MVPRWDERAGLRWDALSSQCIRTRSAKETGHEEHYRPPESEAEEEAQAEPQSSARADDWVGPGRQEEPILHSGQLRRDREGGQRQHDAERYARAVFACSQMPPRAGGGHAFAMGEPVA